MTVTAWFKYDGTDNNFEGVFSNGDCVDDASMRLDVEGGFAGGQVIAGSKGVFTGSDAKRVSIDMVEGSDAKRVIKNVFKVSDVKRVSKTFCKGSDAKRVNIDMLTRNGGSKVVCK